MRQFLGTAIGKFFYWHFPRFSEEESALMLFSIGLCYLVLG